MFKKKQIITIILLITITGSASTLYYKTRIEQISMQKHINDKKTMKLVRELRALAEDIRIATYPTSCDALTKEIIGEDCDLGNYMEWAAPHLERTVDQLTVLLEVE